MSTEDALGPARRFVHVCYCCADADVVADFFCSALAMRNVMQTPLEPSPGAVLGMPGEIISRAVFVYDHFGPRVSPGIEVQQWSQPGVVGVPSTDPFEVGLKSIGYSVDDLQTSEAHLVAAGCTLVSQGASPFGHRWSSVLDPRGVTLDLVQDGAHATQLRHVRLTCSNLARSLAFYSALGFTTTASGDITDAAFLGVTGAVSGRYHVLRLPDQPCELMLVQWLLPESHGRHYLEPNHAGIFRIAFGVDDTRSSYEAMSANGTVFDRAPTAVELSGTTVPDMWICFLSDPDGVACELVQRPRSVFRQ